MLRHITFTVFITTSMNTLATGMVLKHQYCWLMKSVVKLVLILRIQMIILHCFTPPLLILPESNKSIRLIPTQPVIRVEAGQVQQVRFLLQATVPLQSEELKRVTFEGIPPKDDKSSRVTVSIRQDLPVLIHPASLPEERETWKFLEWRKNGDQIEISNPSNYVVRMTLQFKTLPSGKTGAINKTYFLPHTSTTTALTNATDTKGRVLPSQPIWLSR
nr:ORF [Escherichia coli]